MPQAKHNRNQLMELISQEASNIEISKTLGINPSRAYVLKIKETDPLKYHDYMERKEESRKRLRDKRKQSNLCTECGVPTNGTATCKNCQLQNQKIYTRMMMYWGHGIKNPYKCKASEEFVAKTILPKYGFTDILPTDVFAKKFIVDIFAKKDGLDCAIEVTTYVKKYIKPHIWTFLRRFNLRYFICVLKPDHTWHFLQEIKYPTTVIRAWEHYLSDVYNGKRPWWNEK